MWCRQCLNRWSGGDNGGSPCPDCGSKNTTYSPVSGRDLHRSIDNIRDTIQQQTSELELLRSERKEHGWCGQHKLHIPVIVEGDEYCPTCELERKDAVIERFKSDMHRLEAVRLRIHEIINGTEYADALTAVLMFETSTIWEIANRKREALKQGGE